MKRLHLLIVSLIIFYHNVSFSEETHPIPNDFPEPAQHRAFSTFQIKQDTHMYGAHHDEINFVCMEPIDGIQGDPYFDNQRLKFVDCKGYTYSGQIQFFYYNEGKRIETALNNKYGSGTYHNYCLALYLDGVAALETCNDDKEEQQIHIHHKTHWRVMLRSKQGMCLSRDKDGNAISLACGPHETTPEIRLAIGDYVEPVVVRAFNDSSFKWVKLTVYRRQDNTSEWGYLKWKQLSSRLKDTTIFKMPGIGSQLDNHFKSLAWHGHAEVETSGAYRGKNFMTWVTGYWHLSAHIQRGSEIAKAWECTEIITIACSYCMLSRQVTHRLENNCRRPVHFKVGFRSASTGEKISDYKTVGERSAHEYSRDLDWQRSTRDDTVNY